MTRIRVLLVDDHIVVRAGYRVLLRDVPEIEVIGEAESGEAAYRQYVEKAPDVVVMDLSFRGWGTRSHTSHHGARRGRAHPRVQHA